MSRNKLLIILAAGVSFFGISVFALLAFVSYQLRDIKKPLLDALKSQIDGDLKIGDAQVVIFPAGIDLKDIQLYAPGATEPSATVKLAKLRFELIPLVRKKIQGNLTIVEPEILLRRGKDGKTNMERIFASILAGESKARISAVDQLWWQRIAIDKLKVKDAHFKATREGSTEMMELQHLGIEADHIRFDTAGEPAVIKIDYLLPQVSKEPMELVTRMAFEEAIQGFKLSEGKLRWGTAANLDFGGEVLLPSPKRQDVALNLQFGADQIDLKKIGKLLQHPIPASGNLSLKGGITGTAFAPLLKVVLDSPSLDVSGKRLSSLHAELLKKDRPIEIQNASFGIYGGGVGLSGEALPGTTVSAQLNVTLKSLSLSAISGDKTPARLSGNLQLSSPNVANPAAFAGGGRISVGPLPLPVINLQSKVRVAEILSAGTGMGRMVNIGMLASSANVIGTQIDQVDASVKIAGNNITLAPFTLGNGHFTASGNATIIQQKSISGGGTFHLNPGVTAQLIPDPMLRSAVTGGKGGLSVPFSMSGPVGDPNITVDNGYLKGLLAKASVLGLRNMLEGRLKPQDLLNSALKNTPLGDPKNPLGQILGTRAPQQTTAPGGTAARRQPTTATSPQTPRQQRNQAIQRGIQGLLFGN